MNREQHEDVHARGELIKFAVLVLVLLVTVLVVAAARPLIFERIVPSVLGWTEVPTEPGASAPIPENPPIEETPLPAREEAAPSTGQESPAAASSSTPAPAEAAETTPSASMTPRFHIVQQGENLTEIAQRYGVAVDALAQANNLTNRNRIYPGDRLIIP